MHPAGRAVGALSIARSALLVTLLVGVVLGALTGCAVAGSTPPAVGGPSSTGPGTVEPRSPVPSRPTGPPTPGGTPVPTSVVVIGDSITAGAGAGDRAESPGPQSWLPGAQGAPLDFRGGWAVPGATTADMLANVAAYEADVAVVMGGTNDIAGGVDWSVSRANLLEIVARADVGRVVLSAIPPLDSQPAAVLRYNADAAELAAQQGWEFTDPWAGVSQGGAFAPGASPDGVHPSAEVADRAGAALREVLLHGPGG